MENYVLVFLTCLVSLVSCDVGPTFNFEQQSKIGGDPNDYRRPAHVKSFENPKNYRRVQHAKTTKTPEHCSKKQQGPMFRALNQRYAYPDPLPSSSPVPIQHTPYENIFQGKRHPGLDKRVHIQKFEYEPNASWQLFSSSMLFDCVLSHFSVETDMGIPILLRGGVSYRYYNLIVRGRPGRGLSGKIKAYCLKSQGDIDEEEMEKKNGNEIN